MEVSLSYSLKGKDSPTVKEEEAKGILEESSVSVMPQFGQPIYFSVRDIVTITEGNYRIHIELTSGETLTLYNLGYKYEDFLRTLCTIRNETFIKDMLMAEAVKQSGVKAKFTRTTKDGEEVSGECELRLYETALVLIPEKSDIRRTPYCYLTKIAKENFSLIIETDSGDRIILSKMGKYLDYFARALSEAVNELSLKVQATIKELVPDADPLTVRKAAAMMKEGQAARKEDIDSVCPRLWTAMEEKVKHLENGQEYEFLSSLAVTENICIGLKRGLMGDLTGEYLWFLIPIYSLDPAKPGNVVAMESVTEEEKEHGSATYFFRLTGRKEYPKFDNIDELHNATEIFIKRINRCMLAVNFRREPIYLPSESMMKPHFQKYRIAVSAIPELRKLRELFIGRIIHRGPGQWEKDVRDLMRFNARAENDEVKWRKKLTKGGD